MLSYYKFYIMINKSLTKSTFYSLIAQIVIGIISLIVILIPLHHNNLLLKYILILDTAVQAIEYSFYHWLLVNLNHITYEITSLRYFDWFFSTPLMLIILVLFMINNKNKEKKIDDPDIINIIIKNFNIIMYILIFNALMLFFGYFGEINKIPKYVSLFFGFIFLFLSHGLIYANYIQQNFVNLLAFIFNLSFWSLYGVAFMFSYKYKNIAYNTLDVFSKNISGLIIVILIINNYIKNNSYETVQKEIEKDENTLKKWIDKIKNIIS